MIKTIKDNYLKSRLKRLSRITLRNFREGGRIFYKLAGSYLDHFLDIHQSTNVFHRLLGFPSYSTLKPVQYLSTSTAAPPVSQTTYAPTSARPDSCCEGSDRYKL